MGHALLHLRRRPAVQHGGVQGARFVRLLEARAAAATFKAFPPSQRREYVEWIAEAKREETRGRRIAQAIEWLAEGKPRNWKYR